VNPFDGSYSQYVTNRPAAKQWGASYCTTPYQFTEMYSYPAEDLALKKRLSVSNGSQVSQLDTSQTYDNGGKVLAVKYPDDLVSTGLTYTYTYDNLGRPIKLVDNYNSPRTWVDNVQYGPANELKQIGYSQTGTIETRSYNQLGQLTNIQGTMNMEYR
jgi:hypothetical protein